MKRVILAGGIATLTAMFCIFFAASVTNAAGNHQDTGAYAAAAKATPCDNLGDFLKKEYLKASKPGTDSSVRIVGLQEKDALPKALEVCAKLKAKRILSGNDDLAYELPDGVGTITIREVFDGNRYVQVALQTSCKGLPFSELWFVSLKYYNSKR
ncbi:MAG: hypothetical protein LBB79_07675 [Prevotellaceae bacterium]|jgi:hypothetical protein|nr:hypothetical protein [Prevotellaceae bacterium]